MPRSGLGTEARRCRIAGLGATSSSLVDQRVTNGSSVRQTALRFTRASRSSPGLLDFIARAQYGRGLRPVQRGRTSRSNRRSCCRSPSWRSPRSSRRVCRAAVGPTEKRLARIGLSLVLGGAVGNLIDRAATGYVLDFVDVYYANCALLGVQRRRLGDLRSARRSSSSTCFLLRTTTCNPILFQIGRFPIYIVRPAAGGGLPAGPPARRPPRSRRRALDGTKVHGPRHLGHRRGARRREAPAALSSTSITSVSNPADILSLVRSGGVFYGGLVLAVPVALMLRAPRRAADLDDRPMRCARDRAGSRRGAAGVPHGRLLLRTPDRRPVGASLHESTGGRQRRHAAGRGRCIPPSSTRRAPSWLILVGLLMTERRGKLFRGPDVLDATSCCTPSRGSRSSSIAGTRAGCWRSLSTSQFISVLLVPLSIGMLVWLARRGPVPGPKTARRKLAA